MSVISTRELIEAELRHVPEERLDDLYGIVRQFAAAPSSVGDAGILAKLAGIHFQGPRDFAANIDQYLNGEKRVEDDLP